MDKTRSLLKFFRLIVAAAVLVCAGSAAAAELSRQSEDLLLDAYQSNLTRLENNPFGLPLFLDSSEHNDQVNVDVYGIFNYSFASVGNALKIPANWCDIVSLHPNIKACTYRQLAGVWLLTFFIGEKTYQSPDDSLQVIYLFRNIVQNQGYLNIILSADKGPLGTKDYVIRFEALPLAGGRTFVHVSCAYRESLAGRLAQRSYFATLGRGKVGFTVTGTKHNGNPVYIGGMRGAIERNAVRYYFAIQAFMNALPYPEASRFNMRTSEWLDLTGRYRKQLFDLDRQDYLRFKTTEHENQMTLQRSIGTGLH